MLKLVPTTYSVFRKTSVYCIHFYNSGKQRQILTKFCTNNMTSNRKQIRPRLKHANSISGVYLQPFLRYVGCPKM